VVILPGCGLVPGHRRGQGADQATGHPVRRPSRCSGSGSPAGSRSRPRPARPPPARPGPKIDTACRKAEALFGDRRAAIDEFLGLLFRLSTDETELFGTVYAAWNDLLIDGRPADESSIVVEVIG
jgi:hypothetical protein